METEAPAVVDVKGGESTELICAATLYTAWTRPRADRLHAIVYLLCRDEAGAYHPRFAEVAVEAKELDAYYDATTASRGGSGALPGTTPRSVAVAVQSASCPRSCPLETLRHPELWRAAYACVMGALARDVGPFALFHPVRLRVSAESGLVETIECAGGPARGSRPRAGLLALEARMSLDPTAVAARALEAPGGSLAWARLAALRDAPDAASSSAVTVSVATRAGSFKRTYAELGRPPAVREGKLEAVFRVRRCALRPRGLGREIEVRVPLPVAYDYLAVSAAEFSAPALVALYRQWHTAVFAEPGAVSSVFAFLGPEFDPLWWNRDADANDRALSPDQLVTLGFPGWPTLKVTPAARDGAPDDATMHEADTYAAAGVGWPGIPASAALLVPSPARWPRAVAAAVADLSPRAREFSERWHPEHTRAAAQLLDPPAVVGRVWISRYRFGMLVPVLLAHLARLGAGGESGCGWWSVLLAPRGHRDLESLRASLVADTRAEQPAADRFVGAIADAVMARVEEAATRAGFAVCAAESEVAFWGVFNVDPRDAAAARAAEANARAAFEETTAAFLVDDVGLSRSAAAAAACVTPEGTYTHAVVWSRVGRWFWNADDGREHAEGFPEASPAHARAASVLWGALRQTLADPECENPERARAVMEAACDALAIEAFACRGDPGYWGLPKSASETLEEDRGDDEPKAARPLPHAAFCGEALLDRDRGAARRRTLRVRTPDGEAADVPMDLFAPPLILPPIDCVYYMSAIVREIEKVFCGYLEGRWGEESGSFVYPLKDKFGFLL
ncbi:helicase-primase subunit [Saimiriine alphaherpesvirus 1]|uniref:Helicase-primase subunit n=1 Tax=Saimiriine herpesvirus 1 (strain MV-5-4-PSL) TaxID=10353 RepID=E2IUG2_SHV1|nr:helicase-primase subunit [Saimiriine alphaherpesvirus 1]ADO13820.1 helicase-primase subunit [Saimiriine alphaherpesvirus 1]